MSSKSGKNRMYLDWSSLLCHLGPIMKTGLLFWTRRELVCFPQWLQVSLYVCVYVCVCAQRAAKQTAAPVCGLWTSWSSSSSRVNVTHSAEAAGDSSSVLTSTKLIFYLLMFERQWSNAYSAHEHFLVYRTSGTRLGHWHKQSRWEIVDIKRLKCSLSYKHAAKDE